MSDPSSSPVQYEQDDGTIPPDVGASGEFDDASVVGATSLDPLGPIQGMPAPESTASTDATNEAGLAMLEPEAEAQLEGGQEPEAPAAPVDQAQPSQEPAADPNAVEYATSGEAQAAWEAQQQSPDGASYPYGDPNGYGKTVESRFGEYGWDPTEMQALIPLWNETSSHLTQSHTGQVAWRQDAENYMNGAFGIPGLLPDTYESMGANKMKLDDPEEQMRVGLEYIKGKYQTPTRALQHMRQFNWY